MLQPRPGLWVQGCAGVTGLPCHAEVFHISKGQT